MVRNLRDIDLWKRDLVLIWIALLGLPSIGRPQSYSIASGNVVSCSGIIEDTGGPSSSYANNENFTCVICPDEVGASISLSFIVFDLGSGGVAEDQLTIYDGNNTGAPFLGSYSDQQLQGLLVSATVLNSSGCLTLRFQSNEFSVGDFAASISCQIPCDEPVAVLQAMADTLTVCQGEPIQLDGSGSYASPGQNIEYYIWTLGAVQDTTDLPIYETEYNSGGILQIVLRVVDDVGCESELSLPTTVVISPTPSFTGVQAPAVACPGDTVDLSGAAQQPIITFSPYCTPYGDAMFLPDDVGVPFVSSIYLNNAEAGSVINSTEELGTICMDIEHSFLGDLVISLRCPNGQEIALHQQGGGGIFLGEANDGDLSSSPDQGICWNYCFNDQPQYGTMALSTENAIPAGLSLALAPGSYTPVDPLADLIGCPVNGEWKLTVTDLWAADNGFLCSWCLGFDDNQDSTLVISRPTLGTGPDSMYWSGPGVFNDPDEGGLATMNAAEGVHQAIFSV
nr:hypothetical protein [Bacteroidota bacterium]